MKCLTRYRSPINNNGILQNKRSETITLVSQTLDEIFCDTTQIQSQTKYLNIGGQHHYQIELETKFSQVTNVFYPICTCAHIILDSTVEVNVSKEFFELEKKTAKDFIDLVHSKGISEYSSAKRSSTVDKHIPEPTSKAWDAWLLKVLQGGYTMKELLKDFGQMLPEDEIAALYNCILHNPLKQRQKAMSLLALFKGIPKSYVCEHLGLKKGTLYDFIKKYKSGGINRLITHKTRLKTPKYEMPPYITEVFSILHSPPSSHGLNRTTWKLNDIRKVMADKNLPINRRYIAKIINAAGYRVIKARQTLTSNDPKYEDKLRRITGILSDLKTSEKCFSIDEYGPFAVKIYGGRALTPPGVKRTIPQWQKSKGSLIITAALELSTNQITHFYSRKKNTSEMIKLLNLLIEKYRDQDRIFFSWDAASWHASKKLQERVDEINSYEFKQHVKSPTVELAPLPSCAQFLNVIESVFSGMAKAIIHNSDYQSVEECKTVIDRYYFDRNEYFRKHPKRAGKKIWGKERVKPTFQVSNNCKDPAYR